MKMDYIVSKIETSQDGSPFVHVTYSNPNDLRQAQTDPRHSILLCKYDGVHFH
jgi:hypothetical protein